MHIYTNVIMIFMLLFCVGLQCGGVINLDYECGALVEDGPWIFAGLQNMIKVGLDS